MPQTLGLDLKKLETAVKENRFAAKLDRDKRDGQRLGVRKTPSFFVNGRELTPLWRGRTQGADRGRVKKMRTWEHKPGTMIMSDCCESDCGLTPESAGQRRTLRIVLGINAIMFVVIVVSAFVGHSASLLADSLDNLGDALTYGLSLFVVAKGAEAKAKVALFKGALILLAAIGISGQVVYKIFFPVVPRYEIMGVFSLLALAANSVCLFLLWRHRHEDVNMSSVWECSRNDIATNLSVFAAAGAVWLSGAAWPDLLVAAGLVILLIRSAVRVNSSALTALRGANT